MDKAFITDFNTSKKRIKLVQLILDIADNLQVAVVAEGVETKEQLDLLVQSGCPLAQGYYFSKPVPASKFEKNIIEKNN